MNEDNLTASVGASNTEDDPKSNGTKSTLETILTQLIGSPTAIDKSEIENIQEKLTAFAEVRLQTVKILIQLLKNGLDNISTSVSSTEEEHAADNETIMKNVLLVVEAIANSVIASDAAARDDSNQAPPSQKQRQEFKKQFSELWAQVMKWQPKPVPVHKRIVTLLPDKIMPFLTKPLHMSDYLLSAFDLGGPMSVLALHGIFTLMIRHNFEITDFYTRLYSLFTPAIFQPKYKIKFFASSSIFLSSTHLPEALVGAFVKRLARLALLAPTPALPLVFDFIINLMIQHPGLKCLVDKDTSEAEAMDTDPFLEDEPDPLKSRAMDSCLWEIKSLQHHALASVAKKAKFIDKQLPKLEKDLTEVIGYNYEELFKKEMGRRRKKSDQIDLNAMREDLEDPSTSDAVSGPNIKCSRLKGRPCLLETEISTILVPNKHV